MSFLSNTGFGIALKWLTTALIIVAVLLFVEVEKLLGELTRIPPVALITGLVLGVGQVFLSAWRWRYTAALLGIPIPYRQAVREYYLASFTNQVLPGGVLGDVNRAFRHGADSKNRLAAAHGVAIERLSGQIVLAGVVVTGLSWLIVTGRFEGTDSMGSDPRSPLFWLLSGAAVLVLLVWFFTQRSRRISTYFATLRGDLKRTLASWPALPWQLLSSLLVVASYLAVFLVLAKGAGYLTDLTSVGVVAALCSLLLLSMVIPFTMSGWGIREGAAVILWPMVGLPAEQGVALSVVYGALIFVSSLPGGLFLFSSRARQR